MNANPPIFKRTELAQRLASQILANKVGSVASSGLFLAAPRRTGKSTFMREDLRPALEQSGAHVLYVDLWSNKATDPGEMIVSTVRAALHQNANVMARLARKIGVNTVAVPGVLELSLNQIGLGVAISLSDALADLSDELKKPIVLIIDEAQNLTPHEVKTIITRAGENTKIVFTGDVHQIDTPYLDENSNGLAYLIDRLKGQPLFAHVRLEKGERSELANLANDLL